MGYLASDHEQENLRRRREEYLTARAFRVAELYQTIRCSDAGCMFCRQTLKDKGLQP